MMKFIKLVVSVGAIPGNYIQTQLIKSSAAHEMILCLQLSFARTETQIHS